MTKTQLVHLNLKMNSISDISANSFVSLKNLLFLDLSFNEIVRLVKGTFNGLVKLKVLILTGNRNLRELQSGVFDGLESLPLLKLQSLSIGYLQVDTFHGLQSLTHLNISHNNIHGIDASAFRGLNNLEVLDMSDNDILDFSPGIFGGLSSMLSLRTDSYMFCCIRPESVSQANCFPQQDAFSSCEDLMRNDLLRSFLWIFGILSFIGNGFVLSWRLYTRKSSRDSTNRFLVSNLACSDILMGIYLLSIASVDMLYRGKYIWNERQWRNSVFCQILGLLATVSCQGSVFILSLLSIDRFICICFPFSKYKLNQKSCKVSVFFLWMLAFTLALIPIFLFDGGFYSETGICLALPLMPRSRMTGIDYSLAVFVYVNLFALMLIGISYITIYIHASRSGRSFGQKTRSTEIALAKKLSLVILTDFACWFPVIMMGMLSLLRTYTFNTHLFK